MESGFYVGRVLGVCFGLPPFSGLLERFAGVGLEERQEGLIDLVFVGHKSSQIGRSVSLCEEEFDIQVCLRTPFNTLIIKYLKWRRTQLGIPERFV